MVAPSLRLSLFLCLAVLCVLTPFAAAQGSFDEDYPLDVLVRKDGSQLTGLIVAETADAFDFLVVLRRKHKKTLTMQTKVQKAELDLAKCVRLSAADRAARLAEIRGTKAQRANEASAVAQMKLERIEGGLRFAGKRFELLSSAEEDFTKRAIYRLERIFEAYEDYFPVTRSQEAKIKIALFGDMASYQQAVGFKLQNPAVYIPSKNLVLAGADLAAYKAKVAAVRDKHRALRDRAKAARKEIARQDRFIDDEVRKHEKQVNALLRNKQLSRAEAKAHLKKVSDWEDKNRAVLKQRRRDLEKMEADIRKINAHNHAFLNRYSGRLMQTLYHEAFHAFVDNFLFTKETSEKVPHWLHEGLAQFFESSFIEGDTLRIGALDETRVRVLRKIVGEGRALPLTELLAAGSKEFLVESGHPADVADSTRAYVQSWALVYFLAHKFDLRRDSIFDVYIRELNAGKSHQAAFEAMTRMSLADAEKGWQAYINDPALK